MKSLREACTATLRAERGQLLVLLIGIVFVLLLGIGVLGALGKALLGKGRYQRAADLAAVSAARSMRDDFGRLFEPPLDSRGLRNPLHLEKSAYLARARTTAIDIAAMNGVSARTVEVAFPDRESFAPLRVRSAPRRVEVTLLPPSPLSFLRGRLAVTGDAAVRPGPRGSSPATPPS